MKALRWTGCLGNFVVLLFSSSFAWAGPAIDKSGYLTDDRGNFVRNSYGECWRTGFWTPELAVAECDPGLVKAKKESKELQPSSAITPITPPATMPSTAPSTVSSPASIAASAAPSGTSSSPSTAPAAAPSAAPFIAPALVPAKPAESPEKSIMAASLRAETLFDFDMAELKPEGQMILDEKIINGIKKYPETKMLLVTGYTDFIGAENYNQELSERRANAVKKYLSSNGITAQRIKVIGRGESERNPEANTRQTCKDMKGKKLIACLQPDRRVTVVPEN